MDIIFEQDFSSQRDHSLALCRPVVFGSFDSLSCVLIEGFALAIHAHKLRASTNEYIRSAFDGQKPARVIKMKLVCLQIENLHIFGSESSSFGARKGIAQVTFSNQR